MRQFVMKIMESRRIHRLSMHVKAHPGTLIWLLFNLLYAGTCARDLLAADSGEFQLVAAQWGIAHPPGYALYTLVSGVWVRILPLGSIAFRLNFMSTILAATTLALLFKASRTWLHAWHIPENIATLTSFIAVMALGSSATFWAQATTANIRMPTMFFASWAYAVLAEWRATHFSPQALIKLAIITGLGVGHHPSLAFIAIGWVLYIALNEPGLVLQVRRWALLIFITALAWLLPQFYLPLRGSMADVLFAPDSISTWQGFWFHVLAKGFSGDMFAFTSLQDLALRLPLMPTLFHMQFPVLLLLCMGIGGIWLWAKHTRIALSLSISWLIHSFVTITYRAPQTVEYLMPAYIPMALVLALGTGSLLHSAVTSPRMKSVHRASRILVALPLLLLVVRMPRLTTDSARLANDVSIRNRIEPLLTQAGSSDNALILADWRWATPLWYLQKVEHLGENVDVNYVLPEADLEYETVWFNSAQNSNADAIYSTHYYSWPEWSFASVGGGYRLYPHPLTAFDQSLDYAPIEQSIGPVDLLAYRITGEAKPGALLHLDLAWEFNRDMQATPSFATRLWAEDGTLMGMSDERLRDLTQDDGIQFSRFTYMLPIDHCSTTLALTIGVYRVNNGEFIDLGNLQLPGMSMNCSRLLLPIERHWYGWLSSQGPFLTGVDYDTSVGGITWAYTHWCGPGPMVRIVNVAGQKTIPDLGPGECQTVAVPVESSGLRTATYTYSNGRSANLISLPIPYPGLGERYTPFSKDMILVGTEVNKSERAGLATLTWRVAQPVIGDYAVSVRLKGTVDDAEWRLMHDMQPGLGAIPTLKWVQRGLLISDPHPFETLPGEASSIHVTMYERFQMTPVSSPYGDLVGYQLP